VEEVIEEYPQNQSQSVAIVKELYHPDPDPDSVITSNHYHSSTTRRFD
jgi:hypothetical protein